MHMHAQRMYVHGAASEPILVCSLCFEEVVKNRLGHIKFEQPSRGNVRGGMRRHYLIQYIMWYSMSYFI